MKTMKNTIVQYAAEVLKFSLKEIDMAALGGKSSDSWIYNPRLPNTLVFVGMTEPQNHTKQTP